MMSDLILNSSTRFLLGMSLVGFLWQGAGRTSVTGTAPVTDTISVSGTFPPLDPTAGGQMGRPFGQGARRPGSGIGAPTVLREVTPSYTVEALRRKIHGTVRLEVVVTPDGRVSDARVIQSVDPQFGLDAKAIEAVHRWDFRPAIDAGGTPVSAIVQLDLHFKLHGRPRDSLPPSTMLVPKRIVEVAPSYPTVALDARVAGVVAIDAIIDREGNVTKPTVFESVPMLDDAAIRAVSKWKYSPTVVNGSAVDVPIAIYVTFEPK